MSKQTLRDFLVDVFSEAGFTAVRFMPARRCYLNVRFVLAIMAGIIVVWVMHGWVQPYSSGVAFTGMQLLSLIIWQPVIEEVLFRGIIQGQIVKREWGKPSWQGITVANVITSVLFAAIHMINHSPLFALGILAPSLVFGYFRDYCNSVFPSIILHSAYNAMVFVGLILTDGMRITSM